MKICVIVCLLALPYLSFSQSRYTAYLEVRGTVDILGNIYLSPVIKPKRLDNKADSLIDYNSINSIISKSNNPIKALNTLSTEGWTLISVTQVLSDKDGRPNSPFLLYYLRREY